MNCGVTYDAKALKPALRELLSQTMKLPTALPAPELMLPAKTASNAPAAAATSALVPDQDDDAGEESASDESKHDSDDSDDADCI